MNQEHNMKKFINSLAVAAAFGLIAPVTFAQTGRQDIGRDNNVINMDAQAIAADRQTAERFRAAAKAARDAGDYAAADQYDNAAADAELRERSARHQEINAEQNKAYEEQRLHREEERKLEIERRHREEIEHKRHEEEKRKRLEETKKHQLNQGQGQAKQGQAKPQNKPNQPVKPTQQGQ